MKIMPIVNQRDNRPNFKARLEVKIGEEFLQDLAGKDYKMVTANHMVRGIKYLKEMAPTIGTDADVLTLSSKPGRKELFLELNNMYREFLSDNSASYVEALGNIFSKFARDNFDKHTYLHSDDLQKQVNVLRSFNTI